MKDINILLINPGFSQIYNYKREGSSILPSLGLLSIASILKNINCNVEYIDFEVDHIDLKEKLKFKNYLFVGITGVTSYFPAMHNIASIVKNYNPDIPVIVGGPHATLCYDDILNYDVFDAAIIGEGEEIIKLVVNNFKQGVSLNESFKKIQSIAIRGKRDIKIAFVKELDSLPIPAYDLINFKKYSSSIHRKESMDKFGSIITSRGCPYNCKYCKTPFDPPFRYLSYEKVLKQVEYLVNLQNINYLQFWDDTFTLNRKRTIEIAKGLKRFNLKWSINTRVDCIDEGLIEFIKDCGCKKIFYGIESSNEEILLSLNRNIKMQKIKEIFTITKKYGIEIVAGCILGLPYDNYEQIMENIEFIRSLTPDFVHFSIYSPNPKTFLWKECVDNNLLPRKINWLKAKYYKGPPMGMPTCNPYLSRKELQQLLFYAYSLFPSVKIKAERIKEFNTPLKVGY